MTQYEVCAAGAEHVRLLPSIELVAARLFSPDDLPAHLSEQPTDLATLEAARCDGLLWVALSAVGEPVGFARARRLRESAHLEELDVHPDHGRRGLGTRLVRAVLRAAAEASRPVLTLTTFSHVSWNRPYYERLGFRVLEEAELGEELAAMLRNERASGLDNRVAMTRSTRDAE
jgi:GNAT superfamily N-acetyltransferase